MNHIITPEAGGAPVRVETAAAVLAAQAREHFNARYQVAYNKPRDMDAVRQKLLRECDRTSFAESARYSKPIDAKVVAGLGIRFVEAALRFMGNMLIDPALIFDDAAQRIVRVTVTDLETNITYSKDLAIEKVVERFQLRHGEQPRGSRPNENGERVFLVDATEDDLVTKEGAQISKAVRQLGLRLIPGDLQDECVQAIRRTLNADVEKDPDAAKKKIIDAFEEIGIRVEQLKEYLDVSDLANVTPNGVLNLRAVYQAIRDGETNWRAVMEQRRAVRGPEVGTITTRTADLLGKLNAGAVPGAVPTSAADQVTCGICGRSGAALDEFVSPHTGLCAECSKIREAKPSRFDKAPDGEGFDPKAIPGVKTGAEVFNKKGK
jgi:hypothetical protein